MTDLPSPATELFKNLNPEKREKVFQAAVEEFASRGYRNASMNSVVRSAGISKGSLFQYFKSKIRLFDGVVEIASMRVKRYLREVRDETAQMGFFQRLEKLLRSGFAFIDDHPLLARIYFDLLQSSEAPFGAERALQLRREGHEFLADLISKAVTRGELRPDLDVERSAFLLNSLMETLLRSYYTEYLSPRSGLYQGAPDELEKWVRATLDLVSRGMGA